MAKRKNPLKDLDAFLKQEASSFVKPESKQPDESINSGQTGMATADEIIKAIEALAVKDQATYRQELFEIIKAAIEHLDKTSAEDKMLINTILYLKDKPNWKGNIKSYWKEHI